MSHAEFRYRLLATGGAALMILTLGAVLMDSAWTGNLFVAAAVCVVGAVIVMPAPRRGKRS